MTSGKGTHILHLISGLGLGGAERTLLQVASGLKERGFRTTILSLSAPGKVGESLEGRGVEVDWIPFPKSWITPNALSAVRAEVEARDPDLLQSWMYHADLVAALAIDGGGGPPLLWNVRGSDRGLRYFGLRTWLVVRACAWLSHRPEGVVVNSERGREDHQKMGYHPPRWYVIPNGVDMEVFKPLPEARAQARGEIGMGEQDLLIGSVARYHPVKGHRFLLEAFEEVAEKLPNSRLLLIGRGMDRTNVPLMQLVERKGLGERVILLGRSEEIHRWMNALDLFVQPSLSEGFPNTLAEAMACEIPVVATEVGDTKAILGGLGSVVPPADPVALAEGILRVLTKPKAQRQISGQDFRSRISGAYSLDRMLDRYVEVYRQFLRKGEEG